MTAWHPVRCKACPLVWVHTIHENVAPAEVESAIHRAMAHLDWFPVSAHDWLCPDCGWARVLRNDSAATSALQLRKALATIHVSTRRAA